MCGGVTLCSGFAAPPRAELARALSSSGLEIQTILHHEFKDLDGDGIKESIVHGQGNLKSTSVGSALVLSFQGKTLENKGRPVFLPSNLAWDRFVGIFLFDRSSFRWAPILLGSYRKDRIEVTDIEVVNQSAAPLVRLSYETQGRVYDSLYRVHSDGVDVVLQNDRGTWVGEGFWLEGSKLITARALPDPFLEKRAPRGPFAPASPRPGILAKTRYTWKNNRFVPEFWSLGAYGYERRWGKNSEKSAQGEAARKVKEWQRAADKGLSTTRLSLDALVKKRLGDQSFRVVYEHAGHAVVVQEVNKRQVERYYLRPYHQDRKPGTAIWVGLDEL